jgi:hypothetical protein
MYVLFTMKVSYGAMVDIALLKHSRAYGKRLQGGPSKWLFIVLIGLMPSGLLDLTFRRRTGGARIEGGSYASHKKGSLEGEAGACP